MIEQNIFTQSERLQLRALEKSDLPRLVELIGDWDVAKWLCRVPHPYSMKDAEWWLDHVMISYKKGEPEFFVIACKDDGLIIGGIGLHPRAINPKLDELELGYWLGKPYWGKGYMSEAVKAVIALGFQHKELNKITAFTDPSNNVSQNVLQKSGFRYLGIVKRDKLGCIRGSDMVMLWEINKGASPDKVTYLESVRDQTPR